MSISVLSSGVRYGSEITGLEMMKYILLINPLGFLQFLNKLRKYCLVCNSNMSVSLALILGVQLVLMVPLKRENMSI